MRWAALSFLCLCVASPAAARADDDDYYLIVFASQDNTNAARLAHSFAAFVDVTTDQKGAIKTITPSTISWLPATMQVVPRIRPEPGRNFDLKTTLDRAAQLGTRVVAWGPYRIKKELYDSAL